MKELFNDYVQSLETYIMFRIKEKVAQLTPELEKKGRAPISLSMGAPTDNPPKYLIDKLFEAMSLKSVHTYSNPKGEKYFIEAIAKRMKTRFGIEFKNSEICSLIGSKEGIANIIRCLVNPTTKDEDKDIIMIPDPGYASYGEMIKVSGGKAYSVPLTYDNNYMPNLDEIWENMLGDGFDTNKVKALIINYPNNPLGATANIDYFEHVVAFCRRHKILLISDAAYTDMYFGDDVPPSIFQVDGAKDIAVEFYSFSKPYAMTGWRLGWVCGNEEAVSVFGKLKSTIDSGIFKALQFAASEVLNSKEGDDYIVSSNKLFKEKQEIFVKGLKELGYPIDKINIPSSTFYLWLPVPPRYKSDDDFVNELMNKSGVVVVPGYAFGKYGKGFYRVSIVCSKEKLQEAIDRMKTDGFYYNV